MVNLSMRTSLVKSAAIQNGVFGGTCVVGMAASGLLETGLFVEGTRGRVGLADFEKYRRAVGFAGSLQKAVQKPIAEALPLSARCNNNVLQFPFRREMVSDQKSQNPRTGFAFETRYRCLRHQQESCRAFRLEHSSVLIFRPMCGGGGLPFQPHHVWNVFGGCGA